MWITCGKHSLFNIILCIKYIISKNYDYKWTDKSKIKKESVNQAILFRNK